MVVSEFIEILRDENQILIYERAIDRKYEITAILRKYQEKPVFFPEVNGFKIPVVGNLYACRKNIAKNLGINENKLMDILLNAETPPTEPPNIINFKDVYKKEIELSDLPVPIYYPKDLGPYLTSAVVVAKDPETGTKNMSFHRMCIVDEKHLVIRIVPRHLYSYYKNAEKSGKPLDILICIGLPSSAMLSAAFSVSKTKFELDIARTIQPDIKISSFNDIEFPVSDILISGKILFEMHDEGPFVDITGTYDTIRKQPLVRVEKIYTVDNPVFQALLPGGYEHYLLMGMPREPAIYRSVQQVVPVVHGVRLTEGGCSWLHGVVSIEKQKEGDGKNAILAALAGHPSMKSVIIVDGDIDINNQTEVEWAVATRFQPDKDLIIIKNARGSSLDPSLNPDTTTAKYGLDATKELKRKKDFEKAYLPEYVYKNLGN